MSLIKDTAKEYFELKAEAKRIEERLSELRPVLENHIKTATGSLTGESNAAVTVEVGEYGLNLQPASRDNFNFKAAASEFPEIFQSLKDNKIVTKTWYTMLRVTILKKVLALKEDAA